MKNTKKDILNFEDFINESKWNYKEEAFMFSADNSARSKLNLDDFEDEITDFVESGESDESTEPTIDKSTSSTIKPFNADTEMEIEEPLPKTDSIEIKSDICSKYVILHGVVPIPGPENVSDAILNAFLTKLNCECDIIKLYQLNIQPMSDGVEPVDGMTQVYEVLDNVDGIILISDIKKGGISSVAQNAMERIANHYSEKQLRNRIFASILTGEEENYHVIKNTLISYAVNLGMIVGSDCHVFAGKESGFDTELSNVGICLKELSDATSSIRSTMNSNCDEDSIKTFGEFIDMDSDTSDDSSKIDVESVADTTNFMNDMSDENDDETDDEYNPDENDVDGINSTEEEEEMFTKHTLPANQTNNLNRRQFAYEKNTN